MTIHEKAKQLMRPEDIDTHESDLYLRKNNISEEIVNEYEFKSNITTFRNNIDHVLWFDIPFANDDFWKDKEVTP